ncbi:MAG: N-acetyltransferase, partial [Epulopiscium sp.]|nr:N-acetyltransferase [Candidatus Epulonipiscium sp.]
MLTHKGTVPITTVRLTLKKFERDHIHDMFRNWANDDEVTKYLTWPTHKNMAITQ